MRIYKPHAVEVDVRTTETTTLSDRYKSRMITSINLLCQGELIDGTMVKFEIEATHQEREAIIHVIEGIIERFQVQNNEVHKIHNETRVERGSTFPGKHI